MRIVAVVIPLKIMVRTLFATCAPGNKKLLFSKNSIVLVNNAFFTL